MKKLSFICTGFLLFIGLSTYSQTLGIKAAHFVDVKKGEIITPAIIIIQDGIFQKSSEKKYRCCLLHKMQWETFIPTPVKFKIIFNIIDVPWISVC